MSRVFTAEQRAAIDDREGSSLLAAAAGSGKTAVMVERFVEAVVDDGIEVGAILALTFTEKAAGELRDRVRRRFTELGEHEHARTAEAAAIGTIHGFCAGVLRAHPFAAGLDPRFTVLEENVTRRLHDGAYDRAVEAWARDEGAAAIDLLAAMRDDLRTLVHDAYAGLRSRGERTPRLPIPPPQPSPDPADLLAAARAASAVLAGATGKTVEAGQDALAAIAGMGFDTVPLPTDLDRGKLSTGAKLLKEPACDAYREAWETYRQACADHHARPVVVLADRLLARFAAEAARAKTARAAVDFEDLQLLVRDLFASEEAVRRRWSERYALIMVDEFQDTNRLQMDVLSRLDRDTQPPPKAAVSASVREAAATGNLFVVGDAFQSIYGFRHADVEIFRERAAALGPARTRRLTRNFRSRGDLLDVLNAAFQPIFGDEFAPLVAGRTESAAAPLPEGLLFDPDHVDAPPARAPVELLVTDTSIAWEEVDGIGLDIPGEKAWRRAEARMVAQRLAEEVDRGRRPGEIAVLVRAATSLRLIEQALEEQGLPTYVVGGRGYWSQEQVRDGIAYLQVLANPLDEAALYAVLASPFAGVGAATLVHLARAGRDHGGAWAALRALADSDDLGDPATARAPKSSLSDENDDLGDEAAVRVRNSLPDGERARLVRLARLLEAERARAERLPAEVLLERAIAATGYDVAVLGRPGGERRLANLRKLMRLAREYERAEGRDLRAFLAFAQTQDLSGAREGEAALEGDGLDAVRLMTIHRAKGLEFPVVCVADLGRQGPGGGPPLLLGAERVGLRFKALGAPKAVPALDHAALNQERIAREDAEERRLLYVAMTRAEDALILSGGIDLARNPEPRPGGAPLAWILRALDGVVAPRLNDPNALTPAPVARARPAGTALPAPVTLAAAPPAAPAVAVPTRLSFSSLGEYDRCAYRWYLRRVLRLPTVKPPPREDDARDSGARPLSRTDGLDLMTRGSLVHELLEDLDFARPGPPSPDAVVAVAAERDVELTPEETGDVARLVEAFARSSLCIRLAKAHAVRREAPFTFALFDDARGPLVNGVVDVVATEPDGSVLVVDYKTNPLEGTDPETLTTADYAMQRLVYALAALRDGAPKVEVAHCYLERPDAPATAVYGPGDTRTLSEELARRAGALLGGDFKPTATPHRELCGSCPGRRALCSHPETATLRELHPA